MSAEPAKRPDDESLPATAAICRRVWTRHASSRPLPRRLCIADTDQPFEAWILDVSVGGLGLVTSEPLPANTLLLVELETCSRSKPLKLLATVMYCQPTSEGEYRHGCQFIKPPSQQQLRDLLQ